MLANLAGVCATVYIDQMNIQKQAQVLFTYLHKTADGRHPQPT